MSCMQIISINVIGFIEAIAKNFTGVSDPYELPLHPELVIEPQDEVLAQSVARALAKIENMSLVEPAEMPAYREDEAERIRVRPMTLGYIES